MAPTGTDIGTHVLTRHISRKLAAQSGIGPSEMLNWPLNYQTVLGLF